MSLGASIFLLVVGAVLTFAVDVTISGFSIHTVGIILMVAGALGVVLSLLFWSSFSPYRRGGTVVDGDTVVEERRIHRDVL
jgi:predicted membrane channel-forming protein YqfA (hemolysin III family)